MKFSRRDATKLLALPILFHTVRASTAAAQANESSPEFREAVQAAMLEYIDATAIKGKHLIFDPIKGDYVHARFAKLHTNLSKVADTFYVSCADFVDDNGDLVDIDYMVAEQDGYWAVFQSVVHMRDGAIRPSHMESSKVLFKKCCASKCCASKCCASKCCASKCCASKCCASKCCASNS